MKSSLKNEIHLFRPSDRNYPARLREIPGRARILRASGDSDLLQEGPVLAVVGTRNPTQEIEHDTRRVVKVAAEFGMVILSGMSPGVDVIAHEEALKLGLKTIGIAGCGLDVLNESDRSDLAERVVDAGGLLLSPYPNNAPETLDRRWWRNRLIAGLCHGLIMVDSEPDGGALEAHRWARTLERRLIEPTDFVDSPES